MRRRFEPGRCVFLATRQHEFIRLERRAAQEPVCLRMPVPDDLAEVRRSRASVSAHAKRAELLVLSLDEVRPQ